MRRASSFILIACGICAMCIIVNHVYIKLQVKAFSLHLMGQYVQEGRFENRTAMAKLSEEKSTNNAEMGVEIPREN